MAQLQRLIAFTVGLFFALAALLRLVISFIFNPKTLRKVQRSAPACLTDSSYGEHNYIRTASNIKIHYVSKGDQNKPLMLFVHGFPEFWYSWRNQMQGLELDDYRIVAIDLRGYGDSDKPEGVENYHPNLLSKDVKEVIEALGYSSCILVAHDWGGLLAWCVAHEYPEVVDKLIILNAPHVKLFKKYLAKSWEQKKKSWYMMFFQVPYVPELVLQSDDMKVFNALGKGFKNPERVTEEDLEALKYTFGKPGAMTPPLNYYRNIFITKPPLRTWVKKIPAPVLVIWGTGDTALSEGLLEGLDQYVEDLTIRKIVGASHFVHQDEPDHVNEYIREFVSKN